MANWTTEFNGAFFLSIATMVFGFLGLSIKYCLKSKCEDINLCGIHIKRRVDLEIEEEKYEIDHTVKPDTESDTKNI
jgi:hypothetical protein